MKFLCTVFALLCTIYASGMSKKPIEQIEKPIESSELKLSWESKPERSAWSSALFVAIKNEFGQLEQAKDVSTFCPKFSTLNVQDQQIAYAELIVAMAFYESGWNKTSRYNEKTMGIDPITKKPVYSEGLLQLSYQDVQWAKYCEFDWSKDKNLNETDPNKTIFDPSKNLTCGVKILANQIKKHGEIFISKGVYWAVIKEGGRYEKIAEIKNKVLTAFPKCK